MKARIKWPHYLADVLHAFVQNSISAIIHRYLFMCGDILSCYVIIWKIEVSMEMLESIESTGGYHIKP